MSSPSEHWPTSPLTAFILVDVMNHLEGRLSALLPLGRKVAQAGLANEGAAGF